MTIILCLFFYLWALPNTLIGLILALINHLYGGKTALVHGVLEIHGRFTIFFLKRFIPLGGRTLALTIGHVVLGMDQNTLERTRDHERIHVRQSERFGIFFFPLYFIATLIAWLRGEHPYRDNWFEKEAYSKTTIDPF